MLRHVTRFLTLVILFAAFSLSGAQDYPSKPIRLIVPFAPGGINDFLGRVLGQKMGENLGQQVVVDFRPGASGIIGTTHAAKSSPDGYTLLLASMSPLAINVGVYGSKLPYNPAQDFAPISLITKVPQVFSLHSSVPVKNLKQLVSLAKAYPSKITYGTGGAGSGNHLITELFKSAAGIQITHIPFKGAGPATVAVLSGEVDMVVSAPPAVLAQVNASRLKAVAVSSAKRSPVLPDVPTIMESGYPNFEATVWYSLVAPAGTPSPIVEKIRSAMIRAMEVPQVRDRLLAYGANPESSTPDALSALIKSEIVRWTQAVKLAGVKAE